MLVRIEGVVLPPEKHIVIALRSIYGIGRTIAYTICTNLELNFMTKVKELSEAQVLSLQEEVGKHEVEGDLRRERSRAIKLLGDIKSYRGLRHKRRLPVRGQRTKTNARTQKGRKKSARGTK